MIGKNLDSSDYIEVSFTRNECIEKTEQFVNEDDNCSVSEFEMIRNQIFTSVYHSGPIPSDMKQIVADLLIDYQGGTDRMNADTVNHDSRFDGTYEGLLGALAALHGKGLVEADFRDENNRRILTRDDLYRYGLTLFGSKKEAYKFMDIIRKGKGRQSKYQEILKKMGVSDADLERIRNIQFVRPEGSLITRAQMLLFWASRQGQG